MSAPADAGEKQPGGPAKSDPPSELLPPVSPPSAGFILQLFLIPMMIVMIIVMVWLTFSWLAHMGSDPKDLVAGLKKGNKKSWQDAGTLGDLLRNPQMEHLKYDRALAAELAAELELQIKAGHNDPNSIMLRMFICRALGEFRVADGLPALITAATTERDAEKIEPEKGEDNRTLTELDVRRAALEAIALLANNLEGDQLSKDRALLDVLKKASTERGDPQKDERLRAELRSTAAFALGVIGGNEALDQLERILDDAYANARYNAATGLARHGDLRAKRVLLGEMLDPTNPYVVEGEQHESEKKYKRTLVLMNGIRATQSLAEKNSADDMRDLQQRLEELAKSDLPNSVRLAAQEVLQVIKQQQTAPATR
jgi:HEAT repeat protein